MLTRRRVQKASEKCRAKADARDTRLRLKFIEKTLTDFTFEKARRIRVDGVTINLHHRLLDKAVWFTDSVLGVDIHDQVPLIDFPWYEEMRKLDKGFARDWDEAISKRGAPEASAREGDEVCVLQVDRVFDTSDNLLEGVGAIEKRRAHLAVRHCDGSVERLITPLEFRAHKISMRGRCGRIFSSLQSEMTRLSDSHDREIHRHASDALLFADRIVDLIRDIERQKPPYAEQARDLIELCMFFGHSASRARIPSDAYAVLRAASKSRQSGAKGAAASLQTRKALELPKRRLSIDLIIEERGKNPHASQEELASIVRNRGQDRVYREGTLVTIIRELEISGRLARRRARTE